MEIQESKFNSDLVNIKDKVLYVHIYNINDLFKYKDLIDKNVSENKFNVLVVFIDGDDTAVHMCKAVKEEMYNWFSLLNVITIGIADDLCSGYNLELFMACDIRLAGDKCKVLFPKNIDENALDFKEQCELIMGRKIGLKYDELLGKTIEKEELSNLHFINKIIKIENKEIEVRDYIDKIIGNKNDYQVNSIIKCFKNYKNMGINADNQILLEEEAKQFCILVVKEGLKKE